MKTFFRILTFAKPYPKFAIPYFIYSIISTIFGLINFAFLMPILDLLFNATKPFDQIVIPEPGINITYLKGVLDYYTAMFIE